MQILLAETAVLPNRVHEDVLKPFLAPREAGATSAAAVEAPSAAAASGILSTDVEDFSLPAKNAIERMSTAKRKHADAYEARPHSRPALDLDRFTYEAPVKPFRKETARR